MTPFISSESDHSVNGPIGGAWMPMILARPGTTFTNCPTCHCCSGVSAFRCANAPAEDGLGGLRVHRVRRRTPHGSGQLEFEGASSREEGFELLSLFLQFTVQIAQINRVRCRTRHMDGPCPGKERSQFRGLFLELLFNLAQCVEFLGSPSTISSKRAYPRGAWDPPSSLPQSTYCRASSSSSSPGTGSYVGHGLDAV